MNTPENTPRPVDDEEVQRRSRRAFLTAGISALAALGGWRWLATRPDADGIPWPLRRVLEANQQLSEAYFSNAHLAPVFPRHRARMPRVNGKAGLRTPLDTATWKLRVEGMAPNGQPQTQEFSLADIKALPRVEMTTDLKCIEGWSTVVHWAGARFADFVARYPLAGPAGQQLPFVSLVTPDEQYYVGFDMASALHPQTLLCYEMDGKPLTPEHGAPLRLVSPVKYGIKNIKRIGTIRFQSQQPRDYWAVRGYDWYAGL
ncbi:molybdopterin-binding oxidoreductase [Hymenobacter sp. DG25B]|uniref:molybdopterin-dependent oxidoreductase n=1 Tax=Hymenobacter sp. DG25B TaxID=1385664 RepID=UPI0005412058|nr:molybdopterin-dependent oxidoreductase [Hymenobacter sp. DG25B]AIZ63835.1 molybdopterin-binding oxidoreductase [Hymenobacter sp. DG25B]